MKEFIKHPAVAAAIAPVIDKTIARQMFDATMSGTIVIPETGVTITGMVVRGNRRFLTGTYQDLPVEKELVEWTWDTQGINDLVNAFPNKVVQTLK